MMPKKNKTIEKHIDFLKKKFRKNSRKQTLKKVGVKYFTLFFKKSLAKLRIQQKKIRGTLTMLFWIMYQKFFLGVKFSALE